MPAEPHQTNSVSAPLIIGWRELVALPEWGIRAIKTKVDTGARTSAIHVDNIEELPDGRVRFVVIVKLGCGDDAAHSVTVETEVQRITRVRPSTGKIQRRLVVTTHMRIGPVERKIELSLVSRHGMICRMLLGRRALRGDFLIDPSATRLLSGQSDRLTRRHKP